MAVKILDSFSSDELKEEYLKIEYELVWYYAGSQGKQTCLQTRTGQPLGLDGCGKNDIDSLITDYNYLNPSLIGSVWERLITKFNLYRTRLLWINPKSCYSIHADTSPRIHFPIITNPDALFYFKPDGFVYLMPNVVYWVDTRNYHSFVNFSDQPRLHLVGCVTE
jgi:hypothetical protein